MGKEFYLIESSKLICDKGTSISSLKVTSQNFIKIESNYQATEKDKNPNENIFPFGICSITQKSCVPSPTKWENSADWDKIDGISSITCKSKINCGTGGCIKVHDAGQNWYSVMNGNDVKEPPKNKALNKINAFAKDEKTTSVWTKIDKNIFVKDLTRMINNPSTVDQSETNLCGIAITTKISAESKPEKFVEIALSLYEKGSYENIKSNKKLHNKTPTNGLNSAEYIIMTSFRSSLNLFDYDPEDDLGISGMTLPSDINTILVDWFGMKDVSSNYFKELYITVVGTYEIKEALKDKRKVILLVNNTSFEKGWTKTNTRRIPTHYIQILKMGESTPESYDVKNIYWSWGKIYSRLMSPNNIHETTITAWAYE